MSIGEMLSSYESSCIIKFFFRQIYIDLQHIIVLFASSYNQLIKTLLARQIFY